MDFNKEINIESNSSDKLYGSIGEIKLNKNNYSLNEDVNMGRYKEKINKVIIKKYSINCLEFNLN